jgi:hypothetical protein
MLGRIALSVVVAVAVTLGCILVGGLLAKLNVDVAVEVGNFVKTYATIIGLASGIWFFFTRRTPV